MVKALTIKALVVGNKAPLKETGSRNQPKVVIRKLADTVEATGYVPIPPVRFYSHGNVANKYSCAPRSLGLPARPRRPAGLVRGEQPAATAAAAAAAATAPISTSTTEEIRLWCRQPRLGGWWWFGWRHAD